MAFDGGSSDKVEIVVEVKDEGARTTLNQTEEAIAKLGEQADKTSQGLGGLGEQQKKNNEEIKKAAIAFSEEFSNLTKLDSGFARLIASQQSGLISSERLGHELKLLGESAQKAGLSTEEIANTLQTRLSSGIKEAETGLSGFEKSLVATAASLGAALVSVKAFELGVRTIEIGNAIDDANTAFDKFSKNAGVAGSALLTSFGGALDNLLPKYELTQKANSLLLAGLDPSNFELIGKAARSLSETTGQELAGSIDTVSEALLRGNDRSLHAIGIFADLEKAQTDYAASLGKTREELTQAEQLEANRGAILETLKQKTEELGRPTLDAADGINLIKTSLSNFKDEAALAIGTNAELTKAVLGIAEALGHVDFKVVAGDVSEFISEVSKIVIFLTPTKEFIDDLGYSLTTLKYLLKTGGDLGISESLAATEIAARNTHEQVQKLNEAQAASNGLFEQAKPDLNDLAFNINNVSNALVGASTDWEELSKLTSSEGLKELAGQIAKIKDGVTDGTSTNAQYNQSLKSLKDTFLAAGGTASEFDKALKLASTSSKAGKTALEEQKKAAKEASDELKKYSESQTKLYEEAKKANSPEGIRGVAASIGEVERNIKDGLTPVGDLNTEILKIAAAYQAAGGSAEDFAKAVKLAAEEAERAAKKKPKGFDLGEYIGSQLSNDPDVRDGIAAASDSIGSSLMSGIQQAIAGDKQTKKEIGNDIGSGIGGAIGAYYGQPQVGAAIGSAIGSALSEAFGKDSAGTRARKAADRYFADLFDANTIAVVINGQLTQLKDLLFSGNQDPTQGIFAGLGQSAQEQFQTVGDALAAALGLGKDAAVNLGVVLADNGVQLGDLQAIIQATGKSFEDLGDQLFNTFYGGTEDVLQLQQQLQELYGIMSGSSAFADLGAAFDGIAEAGFSGGRQLFNALQSVGIKAQELGATTLPQLANVLVNQFGVAAADVQGFMAAMAAAGIKSIADLVNASNAQLASLGANLEQISLGQAPTNTAVTTPTTGARANFTAAPTTSFGGGSPRSGGGGSSGSGSSSKAREVQQQLDEIERLVNGSKDYDEILKELNGGTLTVKAAQTQLSSLYKEVRTNVKDLAKAQDEANKQLQKNGKVSVDVENKINKLKEAQKALSAATKDAEKDEPFSRLAQFLDLYGDNLSLVNLAAQQAGESFDQLQKKATDAFFSGNETFAQAKKHLDELNGGTDSKSAFDSFVSDGTNGGLVSKNDLQNLAKSVLNSGGTSLDDLSDKLKGAGEDTQQIQKLFIGLKNAGLDSLDSIANIDDSKFINFGATLQDIGFQFKDTTAETRKITEALNAIPARKTIEVTIDGVLSAKSKALFDYLGIDPTSTNATKSVAAPGIDKSNKGVKGTKTSVPKGYAATSRTGVYRQLSTGKLVSL